jgi:type II secretion system protein G
MKRGFTLVELMVVIAIIGILASIVIGSVSNAKASARDIKRVSDIKIIQTALTSYFNDNNHYPCQIYANPTGSYCQPGFVSSAYLNEVPRDPTGVQYAYTGLNANGSANCGFSAGSYIASYHLGAALENLNPRLTSADKDETVAQETSPVNYGACSGTSKFEGNAKTGNVCGGAVISGEDWCYDVTPDL